MKTIINYIYFVRDIYESPLPFKLLLLLSISTVFLLGICIGILLNIWYVK